MMEIVIGLIGTIITIMLFLVYGQHKDVYKYTKRVLGNIKKNLRFYKMSEVTYYKYRIRKSSFKHWDIIAEFLSKRYDTEIFIFNNWKLPVTVIWQNTDSRIDPDLLLGTLDKSEPPFLADKKHREFIKSMEERPDSPFKHEAINYRLIDISLESNIPKINGALGRYYDNVLTQYGMEWEVSKIIENSENETKLLEILNKMGSLPLREKFEEISINPLLDGNSRCASLTISTFYVFKRSDGCYYCLLKRRSDKVGVSQNMFHIIPAGMFESTHQDYEFEWSIKYNILREFLEEIYNVPEVISSKPSNPEHLYKIEPLPYLLALFESKKAELCVTGISIDLLGLRPEINTVLFIDDENFVKQRKMEVNWEYADCQSDDLKYGGFAIRVDQLDRFIEDNITSSNIVCSGAVTLELGRRWLKNIHNIY